MAAAQTFNIIAVDNKTDSTGNFLVLTCQPLSQSINGTDVQSPYTFPYTIQTPTAAQVSGYTYGKTITLTSDK